MKTSDTIGKISADLAKAQGILKNPGKDAVNPHFRNSYATLDAGLNICREALSKHNIALIQATRVDGDILILETRLSHASGEWLEAEYPVCRFPAKPQEMGSAMTYAKRYALFSFVGIAGEDDDDGNAANNTTVAAPARISAEQIKTLEDLLIETGSDPVKFQQYFKVKALTELSAADYQRAVASLEKKKVAA